MVVGDVLVVTVLVTELDGDVVAELDCVVDPVLDGDEEAVQHVARGLAVADHAGEGDNPEARAR